MTTTYTDAQILQVIEWATHLADPIRFADPSPAAKWPGDECADMLRQLLSERQAAMQGQGGDAALAHFTEYFVRNYPGPHTIISDPYWHAPKIFRAAKYAIEHCTTLQPPQPVRSVSEEDVVVIRDAKPTSEGLILAVSAYMIAVKDIFALRFDGPPYNERKVTEDTAALQAFERLNDTGRATRAALEHFAAIAQDNRNGD